MKDERSSTSLFDGPSTTEFLAVTLHLTVEEFVEVFGGGWQQLPDLGNNLDADPEGLGNIFGPWYVSGEPFQLTLRPQEDRVELGVPTGQQIGPDGVYWESHDRRDVRGTGSELIEAAPPIVADLLKRRRAKFRYCRYCRRLTPPEERRSPDVCYDCATDWQGVIY